MLVVDHAGAAEPSHKSECLLLLRPLQPTPDAITVLTYTGLPPHYPLGPGHIAQLISRPGRCYRSSTRNGRLCAKRSLCLRHWSSALSSEAKRRHYASAQVSTSPGHVHSSSSLLMAYLSIAAHMCICHVSEHAKEPPKRAAGMLGCAS